MLILIYKAGTDKITEYNNFSCMLLIMLFGITTFILMKIFEGQIYSSSNTTSNTLDMSSTIGGRKRL